jgi:hypothetical protein
MGAMSDLAKADTTGRFVSTRPRLMQIGGRQSMSIAFPKSQNPAVEPDRAAGPLLVAADKAIQ